MSVTIKMEIWKKNLEVPGESCHVIVTGDGPQNQKYVIPQNFIVEDRRKSSVTISWELEILPQITQNTLKIQEAKVVPNTARKIVSVEILLQDGDDAEAKLGIIHFNYKKTIMKFISSEKYGLHYLDESKIQHKPEMTAMIYDINDDNKPKDTKKNNSNSRGKSVPVMNRKEAHEKWGHQYKDNCEKMT